MRMGREKEVCLRYFKIVELHNRQGHQNNAASVIQLEPRVMCLQLWRPAKIVSRDLLASRTMTVIASLALVHTVL